MYVCGSKPHVVAGPPRHPSVTSLCRGYALTYYLKVALCFGGFVAEGFVEAHPCLSQTHVAKWPPKPVTNPMVLIRCHMYVYVYIFTYVHMYIGLVVTIGLQRDQNRSHLCTLGSKLSRIYILERPKLM